MNKVLGVLRIYLILLIFLWVLPKVNSTQALTCCNDSDCASLGANWYCDVTSCTAYAGTCYYQAPSPPTPTPTPQIGGGCSFWWNCPGCQSCVGGTCVDDSTWCHQWVGSCSSCSSANCTPSVCAVTPTLAPTPTPGSNGLWHCNGPNPCFPGANCSIGECYDTYCDKPCGFGGNCTQQPKCSTWSGCDPAKNGQDCPGVTVLGSCAQSANCENYDKCGCSEGCTPYCDGGTPGFGGGTCKYAGKLCANTPPGSTPTLPPGFPTPTPTPLPPGFPTPTPTPTLGGPTSTPTPTLGPPFLSGFPTPTPTLAPGSLTCTVSGASPVNAFTDYPFGAAGAGSGLAGVGLYKSPESSPSWTTLCTAGASCTAITQFAPGTYWAVCNAYSSSTNCTGNPWCIGGTCPPWTDCGAGSRMVVTTGKSCNIAVTQDIVYQGSPIVIAYNGNNHGAVGTSDDVILYLVQWNSGTTVTGVPGGPIFDAQGRAYYRLNSCVSSGGTPCSSTYTLNTTGIPQGVYSLFCQLNKAPSCSGNPYCTINGGPTNCGTFWDCSATDNKFVEVLGACDPASWGACSNTCGTGIQTNPTCPGLTQDCCNDSGCTFSACSGSPAKKTKYSCLSGLVSTSCTGTINARGMTVPPGNTACTTAPRLNGVDGTVFYFSPGSASTPPAKTQTGASYVSFAPVAGGTYTIVAAPPPGYTQVNACWTKALNIPTSGPGTSTTLSEPVDGDTLTWETLYIQGSAWVQLDGTGDAYASGIMQSLIPPAATPRLFNANGSPGVVTYGTAYDFDADPASTGAVYTSSKGWLAQDTNAPVDYYDFFYRRLGSPTANDNGSFPGLQVNGKPAVNPAKRYYYIQGDLTIQGANWSVGSGDSIIFLVNGNLNIRTNITISGTGFVAFIASGDIAIDGTVGRSVGNSTPVLEGIYVANGTFQTGQSANPGSERLVARGMFVAGDFSLQRDVKGNNATVPSELFIYNPQLLFIMPEILKEVPVTWQEIPP